MDRALIAEGEASYACLWCNLFGEAGVRCSIVSSVREAKRALASRKRWRFTIIDERLDDGSAMELLPECSVERSVGDRVTVVSLSEVTDTSLLVEAYFHAALPVPRALVARTLSALLKRLELPRLSGQVCSLDC